MKKRNAIILVAAWMLVLACVKEEVVPVQTLEPYLLELEAMEASDTNLVVPQCPCFSNESLEALLQLDWESGWWSDVPGCRKAPYGEMQEIWIPNAKGLGQSFDVNVQAGLMLGKPFASASVFNRRSGSYDLICGGYMEESQMQACRQLLTAAILQLREKKPQYEYCSLIPVD
jgi:hypothetical protein